MPVKFEEWPDAKYIIFVNKWKDRRVIFIIEGKCTMEECTRFVSKYPMEAITSANEGLVPITTDIFENAINMNVMGICTSYEGQRMPDWLQYLTDDFGGRMRFTDAYTFHILKHMVLTKTGELM